MGWDLVLPGVGETEGFGGQTVWLYLKMPNLSWHRLFAFGITTGPIPYKYGKRHGAPGLHAAAMVAKRCSRVA